MIVDKSVIGSFSFLCPLNPFFALFDDLFLFYVKVSSNNLFETFGWMLYLSIHRITNVTKTYYIWISFIFSLSFLCSLFALEARLIEINIITHSNTLSRNEQLKQSWDFRIPILWSWSSPSSKKTQANLTTWVKIWIKSYFTSTSSCNEHFWRVIWIWIITIYIKCERTIWIRSVFAAHNHNSNDIDSWLVASNKNRIGMFAR